MSSKIPSPFPGSYWVEPGKLLAGPYPRSIFPIAPHTRIGDLLQAGIQVFVDLTEPREMPSYVSKIVPHAVHKRFPIPDMDIPSRDLMVHILDTIDMALSQGQPVYVHCLGGIGRTGTVIGCWLVRHGLEGEVALGEIQRLRDGLMDSPQTEEQCRMVLTWKEGGPR